MTNALKLLETGAPTWWWPTSTCRRWTATSCAAGCARWATKTCPFSSAPAEESRTRGWRASKRARTTTGLRHRFVRLRRAAERLFGTPGYLPPEALRGGGVGRAGDLFALAPPPPLRESGGEVPPEVDAIVGGLRERDPRRRIADALLLAVELDRLCTMWRWRWAMPPPSLVPAAADSAPAPTDAPHAQIVGSLAASTAPGE